MERPDFEVLENNLLEGFDVHLQEFYKNVIGKETDYKYGKYAEDIKDSLKEIILHYKKEYTEKLAIDLRFSTREKRCAYILKHSPLFTSTVAFHFSELLKQKEKELLMKAFKRRLVNLCCLGGGPASELVAIAKVLGPLYSSTGNQELLELKVTIVDINEHWKTTCEYVIECLKEDETFVGMDRIAIDFSLIQADLSKPFKKDVREVIEKADIITMVYFVSAVNGGKDSKESLEMIKNIMEIIKEECIVFFLDNATDIHFQQMDKAANETSDMEIIYEPCVEELRCLTLKSVKKFLDLYKGHFDLKNCMTHGFMSYCVWRKVPKYLDKDEEEEKKRQEYFKSQKNNERLTRRMKDYRVKLHEFLIRVENIRLKSSKEPGTSKAKESLTTTTTDISISKTIRNNEINKLKSENENCSNTRGKNPDRDGNEQRRETGHSIEDDTPTLTNIERTRENKQENIALTFHKKELHHEENIQVSEREIQSTSAKVQNYEKQINYSLNAVKGRQSDINESRGLMKSEVREKSTINDVDVQHESSNNGTRIEIERGNNENMDSKKEDGYKEKGCKNVKKDISEHNLSEEFVKEEPVINNEGKDASRDEPKASENPVQKPGMLKSKEKVSQSQQEKNDKDDHHDNTVADEQNSRQQEKGNEEREFDRKLITITETQNNIKGILKSSLVHPTKYTNTIENMKDKSNIQSSYKKSDRKVTFSVKTESLMKRPSVPTTPLKRPRELKKSGASSSNSHLDDINEEENGETMSDKIISKESCDRSIYKTQKLIHAPKVRMVPLTKPRELKKA